MSLNAGIEGSQVFLHTAYYQDRIRLSQTSHPARRGRFQLVNHYHTQQFEANIIIRFKYREGLYYTLSRLDIWVTHCIITFDSL